MADSTSARVRAAEEPCMTEYARDKLESDAKRNWDMFYKRNTTHFFKDRHWIQREFIELQAMEVGHVC